MGAIVGKPLDIFRPKRDLDDGEGAERQSDDEDRKGKLQALAACLKVKK